MSCFPALKVLVTLLPFLLLPSSDVLGQEPDDIRNAPYTVDGVPVPASEIPAEIREAAEQNKSIAIVPEGAIWTYDVFLVDGKIIKSPPYFFTIDSNSRAGKGLGSGSITDGGGYSLKSQDGSAVISGGSGNSLALGVARGLYASQRSLPGIFSSSPREGWIASNTKQSIDRYQKEVEFQSKTIAALEESQKKYSNELLTAATKDLSQLNQAAEAQLRAKFGSAKTPSTSPTSSPPTPPGPRGTKAALPEIRKRIDILAQSSDAPAHAKWAQMEGLVLLKQKHSEILSPVDSLAIEDVLRPYFDENGLVNANVLGGSYDPSIVTLGRVLKTPAESKAGQLVRFKINKALSQLSLPQSVENVFAALAHLIAADEALSVVYNSMATHFMDAADAILGFTPAGAIVDASQIFCGLATGYDLSGNKLERSDYLLRGLAVVFGVFGLRNVVTVGNVVIPKTFVIGSEMIRRFGIGRRVGEFTAKTKGALFDFVESVGKKFQSEKTLTRAEWVEYLGKSTGRLAQANGAKFMPDTIESVVKSSQRASREGSKDSRALQSLRKKVDRKADSAFQGTPLTESEAQATVRDILKDPDLVQYADRMDYLDVYDSKGRGIRFVSSSNEFKTFLEKSLLK